MFFLGGGVSTVKEETSESCAPVRMAVQATRVIIFTRWNSHVPSRLKTSVPRTWYYIL